MLFETKNVTIEFEGFLGSIYLRFGNWRAHYGRGDGWVTG
jgi:hypothetical protein